MGREAFPSPVFRLLWTPTTARPLTGGTGRESTAGPARGRRHDSAHPGRPGARPGLQDAHGDQDPEGRRRPRQEGFGRRLVAEVAAGDPSLLVAAGRPIRLGNGTRASGADFLAPNPHSARSNTKGRPARWPGALRELDRGRGPTWRRRRPLRPAPSGARAPSRATRRPAAGAASVRRDSAREAPAREQGGSGRSRLRNTSG